MSREPSRERPILFSSPMVRALIAGTKTQTRRVVRRQFDAHAEPAEMGLTNSSGWQISGHSGVWWDDTAGNPDEAVRCPYGAPGDRLLCYHCAHGLQETSSQADSGISKRRLHGGVGRTDLQPNEVQGFRSQGTGGLVSASGPHDAEGVSHHLNVAREREGHEVGSSLGLHGVPRDASCREHGGSASERQPCGQPASEPSVGHSGRELAGQAPARPCNRGGEAPGSQVHGRGEGAHSLGGGTRPMQPAAGVPCARCGALFDSGHRVGGTHLWVRETWAAPHAYDHLPPRLIPQDARIHYAATEERGGLLWRPSIHMPRWASRLTLEITGVRVERLQEISEADAVAEGTPCYVCDRVMDGLGEDDCHCFHTKARPSDYRALWEQINGEGSWDANPWVWVLEFRKLERQ